MVDVYDAKQLLSVKDWKQLFSSNPDNAHKEYRMLCKIWHPDISKDKLAGEVFKHVVNLYEGIGKVSIPKTNVFVFKNKEGKTIEEEYIIHDVFEMGNVYIGRSSIIYLFDERYSNEATSFMTKLSFAYKSCKENSRLDEGRAMSFYPPRDFLRGQDGKHIILFERSEKIYRLDDVIRNLGSVHERNIAWIISRLCNFVCLIYTMGISHNGLTLKNCYIGPEQHTVSVLGGWQYSTKLGSKMQCACSDVFKIMPVAVKNAKLGSISTDIESVKEIGRRLVDKQKVPDGFNKWLWDGNAQTPYEEFEKWDKALTDSYGKRRFWTMEVTEDQILH